MSGVKWRRAARDLLRIFKRLYCTVRSAFCSAASVSALGGLAEACGARWARGMTAEGSDSPFLVWGKGGHFRETLLKSRRLFTNRHQHGSSPARGPSLHLLYGVPLSFFKRVTVLCTSSCLNWFLSCRAE